MSVPSQDIVAKELARHQPRLRGFVRCLLIRPADVDDVLQEINAVIWEKAHEFEEGTDFWAWASQIARFKVLNRIRRYGRDRLVFDEDVLLQLAEVAQSRLEALDRRSVALDHCLQQLPPAQRQLIGLRYEGGHAIEVISEMIGRPKGSVRQSLYRIRNVLLACIEGRLAMEGDAS